MTILLPRPAPSQIADWMTFGDLLWRPFHLVIRDVVHPARTRTNEPGRS